MIAPRNLARSWPTVTALFAVIAVASGTFACSSKSDEPQSSRPAVQTQTTNTSSATSTRTQADPPRGTATAQGQSTLKWDAPSSWTVVANPSPMRKATYQIPRATGDSDDAELTVTQVGGTLEANIQRWVSQFEGEPSNKKRWERSIAGMRVTFIEVTGTLKSAVPGAASASGKTDQTLLVAVVETPNQPHFFKMVGPKKTVENARNDFEKMIDRVQMPLGLTQDAHDSLCSLTSAF